ncbi:TPA: ATP-dependent helicase [Yersinia enterocolitica]|nr:ATP-dependent helicase [Yersinia enterocolitica]HDL7968510.1 ATP-dependent helicase [Yersinia enterocolitica]HDL8426005.1 ATP-dependent helicase [Yersinia enterocolitica]
MLNLSSSQAQIVHAPFNKAIQVLASAGSGKTRVLTERVRYILQNTKKDGVIALTFTNKAAEEMSVRLEDCIEAEDRAWIATIHSVAQRILEKYGHTVGLPAELHIYDRDKDRMEVFLQSLREDGVNIDEYLNISDSKELKSREKNLQNYMDIFSRIKRELFTESDVTEKYPNNNIWKIFQDYQSSLVNSGGIDYDDILVYAHKILLTHNWIAQIYRSQYKHICIDEAQDLNKAQYEFIKALCGDVIQSIFMVGDPNQMIYGFNGSSKEYLCTYFLEDFTPFQFELRENYRSAKAIIRAANKLKPNSQAELDYALEGGVKIVSADTEEAEAEWITSTIKLLLELKTHPEIEGDISLDKMVVIARNRFVFNKLEACLKQNNINYSMRKGERQLEPTTIFGRILDYSIRIKLNPKDWVDGKKLCSLLGIIAPTSWSNGVLNILANQTKKLDRENAELYSELMNSINNLDVDEPNIRKFVRLFEEKLTSLISQADAPSEGKSEEIKLSLDELNEFSRAWTLFKRKGLGGSLVAFRNALALGQLTENSLENGVLLSTVHTMKGLEKDIVFLMGMCEGVFPDYRANSIKEIDEERNNAFVAVTRAKRWLYVTYPKQRMMPWKDLKFQQKSRFVKEIE